MAIWLTSLPINCPRGLWIPPIAIELIEEAAIAVGHMMSTLFFPVVPFLMEVVFVIWFIVVAAFLGIHINPTLCGRLRKRNVRGYIVYILSKRGNFLYK